MTQYYEQLRQRIRSIVTSCTDSSSDFGNVPLNWPCDIKCCIILCKLPAIYYVSQEKDEKELRRDTAKFVQLKRDIIRPKSKR